MNPSVGDMNDEADAGIPMQVPKAENEQLSWPKICSQHDFILSSHLKMLESARDLVHSDEDMSRTISSMLDKTNKLMSQFHVVKKQMMDRKNGSSASQNQPKSTSQVDDANSTTAGSNAPMRKKRARTGVEKPETPENDLESTRRQEGRSQKRKRVESYIAGNDEDVRNAIPVSAGTEDISEEVQRRLEIKEEQRRRRNAKPEKRKRDRDSLASDDGISSLGNTARPKKKRREVGAMSEHTGME